VSGYIVMDLLYEGAYCIHFDVRDTLCSVHYSLKALKDIFLLFGWQGMFKGAVFKVSKRDLECTVRPLDVENHPVFQLTEVKELSRK
jgi:hypothetical protein